MKNKLAKTAALSMLSLFVSMASAAPQIALKVELNSPRIKDALVTETTLFLGTDNTPVSAHFERLVPYVSSVTTVPRSFWKTMEKEGTLPKHDNVECGKDSCAYSVKSFMQVGAHIAARAQPSSDGKYLVAVEYSNKFMIGLLESGMINFRQELRATPGERITFPQATEGSVITITVAEVDGA